MPEKLPDLVLPGRDPRVDVDGAVYLKFSSADEYQAFVGFLNRANIIMAESAQDVPMLTRFMPHFFGNGLVSLEISMESLEGHMEEMPDAPAE